MLIGVVLWGIFGSVAFSTTAQGILLPITKISESESLIKINFKERQEKVDFLEYLYNKKKELYSKHYITLIDVIKAKEEMISARNALPDIITNLNESPPDLLQANTLNSGNISLAGLIFLDHVQGKKVKVGMNVYLLPSTTSSFDYGYIVGKVVGISAFPMSKQLAYAYLGNMNLVDEYFTTGAPYMAKIMLQKNINTISQLSWTTKSGPPFPIESGTTISAKIIYKQCSPIHLLINYDNKK